MRSAQDSYYARQRPEFFPARSDGTEPLYVYVVGEGKRVTLTGTRWHRVERRVAEALRAVPLHDLGAARSPKRFDVLSASEFEKHVVKERERISAEQEADARALAEQAVQAELEARAGQYAGTVVVEAPVCDINPRPRLARKRRS